MRALLARFVPLRIFKRRSKGAKAQNPQEGTNMQRIASGARHFGRPPASPELAASMQRMHAIGYCTTWQSTYERLITMGIEPRDFGQLSPALLQYVEEESLV